MVHTEDSHRFTISFELTKRGFGCVVTTHAVCTGTGRWRRTGGTEQIE